MSPWLPLVVLPLLCRVLPNNESEARWSWAIDLPLAVLSGVALVGLGGVWLSQWGLVDPPGIMSTPDFQEYCGSVAVLLGGEAEKWSYNRSLLSGAPAILAARRLGVVDGLLVGAMVGQAGLGAGLYVWGRALHSRLAGVSAALLAAALFPLAVLGRTVTFYPVIIGALTLATATAAAACRWPSVRTVALAGAGAGLALLVDLRGLVWGLAIIGLAGAAALGGLHRRPPWWGGRLLARLGALALMLRLAWALGPSAYPPQTTTLEVLGDPTKGWSDVVVVLSAPDVPTTPEAGGYVWGRSSPLHIPKTLRFMRRELARTPPEVRDHPKTRRAYAQYIAPLVALTVGAALLTAWGLRRHPLRLAVLVGTCLPFAVALQGAVDARFADLRFIANGFVFLPLWMGLGWASLVLGAPPETIHRRPRLPWRSIGAVGLLTLVVLGGVPTVLSPAAPWRRPENGTLADTLKRALDRHAPSQQWPECDAAVRAELDNGQPTLLWRLP